MAPSADVSYDRIDSPEVITLNKRKSITIFFAALCFVTLIMDTRTGISGAAAGIDICIKTLIPSLFPFFTLSILLTSASSGQTLKILRPITKFCRIPAGSESFLIIGFLGGYPVGAQNIAFAANHDILPRKDAQRMVVFCNNAGPAFIFGFLGQLFDAPLCPWLLWVIHVICALLVGHILPGSSEAITSSKESVSLSVSAALDSSIRVMARVCGWVVLFRIILEFLRKWILWLFPTWIHILFAGLLELTNGCIQLQNLPSDGIKLILSSVLLGFGGLCVFLQTHSIAGSISLKLYVPGKILHGTLSFLLAYLAQFYFLKDASIRISPFAISVVGILILLFALTFRKIEKPVAFSDTLLYNQTSCEMRRRLCFFEERSQNPVPTAFMAQN